MGRGSRPALTAMGMDEEALTPEQSISNKTQRRTDALFHCSEPLCCPGRVSVSLLRVISQGVCWGVPYVLGENMLPGAGEILYAKRRVSSLFVTRMKGFGPQNPS